jgi:hypothetical protein
MVSGVTWIDGVDDQNYEIGEPVIFIGYADGSAKQEMLMISFVTMLPSDEQCLIGFAATYAADKKQALRAGRITP